MEQQDTTQVETVTKETPVQKNANNPIVQFFAGILIVLFIALLGVYIFTKSQAKNLSSSPFVLQTAEALRVPIAKINGNLILYVDFMQDFTSLKKFYSNQPEGYPAPAEKDIAEQVLSRLLINLMVKELASTYGVVMSQEDLTLAKSELLSQFPDEKTAEEEINKTFGWSLETFTDRIIRPIVLEQKVASAFSNDNSVDDKYSTKQVKAKHILFLVENGKEEVAKAKAQEVLDRIKNGEDFASLAKEFGKDGTAEAGGDLGWISKGTTIPSFEQVLFALQAGELYGEIAQTEFGYHIVKAEEIRNVNNFSAFFQDLLANAKVKIFADIANPFSVKNEFSADAVSKDNSEEGITIDPIVEDGENGEVVAE